MSNSIPVPSFGGKRQAPEFYPMIHQYIDDRKQTTTLRDIAEALNKAGIRTATGLRWSKSRLANFIRTTPRTVSV